MPTPGSSMDFPMEQTSEKEKMMGWISRVAEREGEDAWEAVLWIRIHTCKYRLKWRRKM